MGGKIVCAGEEKDDKQAFEQTQFFVRPVIQIASAITHFDDDRKPTDAYNRQN